MQEKHEFFYIEMNEKNKLFSNTIYINYYYYDYYTLNDRKIMCLFLNQSPFCC
jgi:hypothetical protein